MNTPRRNIRRGVFFYLTSLFSGIPTDELYFITLVLIRLPVRPSRGNWLKYRRCKQRLYLTTA